MGLLGAERSGGAWAPSQFWVLGHLHGLHLKVALLPQWLMTASPPSSRSSSMIFSSPRFLQKFQDGALSTQATCPRAGEIHRCDVFIFWSPAPLRGWGLGLVPPNRGREGRFPEEGPGGATRGWGRRARQGGPQMASVLVSCAALTNCTK